MNIFEKPKYKSHAELDRQWKKLSREWKTWGLARALEQKERIDNMHAAYDRKREWEKGKKVGKECTCLPEKTGCSFVDELCSYCYNRRWDEYDRSPG